MSAIGTLRVIALTAAVALALVAARPKPGAAQTGGGRWAAPEWPLGADAQSEPDIAFDAAGAVHVVWTAPETKADGRPSTAVRYAVRDGAGWSTAERIACPALAAACSEPAVAVDSLGIVHVVFVAVSSDGAEILHRQRVAPGDRWSAPEVVSAGPAHTRRSQPAVATDRVGNVHVAWCDLAAGSADILYRQRLVDGTWRDVSVVNEPLAGAQSAPSLTLAADGTLHAVWLDDRGGPRAVWTSQLPERSFVWWPDATVSGPPQGIAGRPVVVGAPDGVVTAVWPSADAEGATALRTARQTPAGPYWEPARILYREARGAIGNVAAAAGPNAQVAVAWTEARPGQRSRLYAGLLNDRGDLTEIARVDGTVDFPEARVPVMAVDALGTAILVWEQPRRALGAPALAASMGRLPEPQRAWRSVEGYVSFEPIVFGCQRDGYRLTGCDGTAAAVLSDDPALARLIGAYVTLEGWVIADSVCPRVTAERFSARTPPCDQTGAAVLGQVTQGGRALSGARVSVGRRVGLSGRSGRFGLSGLTAATVDVTATAPCALDLSAGAVALQPRQRLDLGTAAFVAGDANGDCVIDVRDLARVAHDVRRPIDEAQACSDVNRDGTINIVDLGLVGQRLGLRCPQPWSPTPAPPMPVAALPALPGPDITLPLPPMSDVDVPAAPMIDAVLPAAPEQWAKEEPPHAP